MAIQTVTQIDQLDEVVSACKQQQQRIGLVPTMGALHEGHLSLVRASLESTDTTLVSVFVNPTQFAANEDLGNYPRTLDSDLAQLESLEGSQSIVVFAPPESEIYPSDFTTRIRPPAIAKVLEGEFRPDHFGGVVTVVLKLFNLAQADVAFFGQKDYQQVAVIRQMVKDLNVPITIQVCPIVRDDDGLALSSRNAYLSDQQREVALTLTRTLSLIEDQIQSGLRDGFEAITEMRQALIDGGVDAVDYAVVADPDSLETMDPIRLPAVALIAARVGTTRLIDNRLILPPG